MNQREKKKEMRNSFPTDTTYFLGYKFLLLTSCRFLLLRSSTDRGILHKTSPRATNCAPAFCQGKKSISTCKLHMAKHHFVTQQNGMVITEKSHFLCVSIHFLTSPTHVTTGQCNSCPHYHFLMWKS